MAHKPSHSEVAAFLAKIEPDYARDYSFKVYLRDCKAMEIRRDSARLADLYRDRWPLLTRDEAAAFVQLFLPG